MDIKNSVTFCHHDLISSSFRTFEEMRKKGELADFKMSYGDRCVFGHRLILAAAVPYFRTLFSQSKEEVSLEGISSDALESIVVFAYSGKIEITSGNVENLILASTCLQLTQVQDACWEFLENGLHLGNVWPIRKLAEDHHRGKLMEVADHFIRSNFKSFTETTFFSALPVAYLKELIKGDHRDISDVAVYESVIRWVKVAPSERKDFLFELLNAVSLFQLSTNCSIDVLLHHQTAHSSGFSAHGRQLSRSEVDIHHASLEKSSNFNEQIRKTNEQMRRLISRSERCTNAIKSVKPSRNTDFGGIFAFCSSESELSVKLLDPENKKWKILSSYESSHVQTVTAFNHTIYIFLTEQVLTFDANTLKWRMLDTVYTSLMAAKSILHHGKIYFFGVTKYFKGTVQCFDPQLSVYFKDGKMTRAVRDPGVASWDEFIFITGGTIKRKVCNAAERYHPDTKEWIDISPMLLKRWEHGCATLRDLIYVCGGYDAGLQGTAEVYDPLTDKWSFISDMNVPRWEFHLVPYNGKLYTFQKRPGYLNTSSHTEIYDPERDEWELSDQTPADENCVTFLTSVEISTECDKQGEDCIWAKGNNKSEESDSTIYVDSLPWLPSESEDCAAINVPKKFRKNKRKFRKKKALEK